MNEQISNDLSLIVAQAIEKIKDKQGTNFSVEKINLAELKRLTAFFKNNRFLSTTYRFFKSISDFYYLIII